MERLSVISFRNVAVFVTGFSFIVECRISAGDTGGGDLMEALMSTNKTTIRNTL